MGGRAGRGARARRRRAAETPDLSDSIVAFAQWVVLPAVLAVFVVVTLAGLGESYAARRGEGTYGEFHGTERRCHTPLRGETTCDELWGEFAPEGGGAETFVRHMEPPEGFGVGGRTRALLPDGVRDRVYRAERSREWLVQTLSVLAACTGLAVWGVLLARRRQQRA